MTLVDKMATARSKVHPNAFSDNFVLFWLLPVQCDSRCKEGCNYLWHDDCSVVLMWLGNADELLQICLWHAIFCYLFGITLLCMLICGDAAGLAPGCGLLRVVGSPGPRLQLPPRHHTATLVVVTFSLSYTLSGELLGFPFSSPKFFLVPWPSPWWFCALPSCGVWLMISQFFSL
jgi:hypothetical protein